MMHFSEILRLHRSGIMAMMRSGLGILAIALAALLISSSPAAAQAAGNSTAARNGLIALTLRDASGWLQIFTIRPGRDRTEITDIRERQRALGLVARWTEDRIFDDRDAGKTGLCQRHGCRWIQQTHPDRGRSTGLVTRRQSNRVQRAMEYLDYRCRRQERAAN